LVLVWRSQRRDEREAAREKQPVAESPAQPVAGWSGDGAHRELLVAWVQFLKADLSAAVNALHNRLNAIANAVTLDSAWLTPEQKQIFERVRTEVHRAAKITSGLLRRVDGVAPDTMPPVLREYDGSRLDPARILVVEDDDSNRAVMRKVFEALGHEVVTATNGLEAFNEITEGAMDCVLCDLRLPYADGRTLFEQVEYALPDLAGRFVFVTGAYNDPESRAFLDLAGQPVVGKPYELDALLGAVAAILRRRRLDGASADNHPVVEDKGPAT